MLEVSISIRKKAALVSLVALGVLGLTAVPASAHYYTTRCDADGDRCYQVYCDDDGDNCVRVRTRQPYRRSYGYGGSYGYNSPYGYGGYNDNSSIYAPGYGSGFSFGFGNGGYGRERREEEEEGER